MKQIDKKKISVFGHSYWLVGVRKEDGKKVWMREPSWDCGWYWGGLYLTCFTNDRRPEKSKDISEHFHFDGTFLNKDKAAYDLLDEYFESMTIPAGEQYRFVDYMMTYYSLRSVAALARHGYSYQTPKAKIEGLQDEALENRINGILLPTVFDKLEKLLTEE